MVSARLVAVFAALVLVTGCGGSPTSDKKPESPPAVTYTAKDLQAALPSLDEVPNGRKVLKECPGSKDCVTPTGATAEWSVDLEMAPTSPVDLEMEERFFGSQLAIISVAQFETETAATAQVLKHRENQKEYVGTFDTKAVENEDKTFTPGYRGEGLVGDTTHGDWTGFQFDKTYTLSGPGPDGLKSEPRQDALVELANGRVTLSVLVSLGSHSLADGDAKKLAEQLVDEYFERLG